MRAIMFLVRPLMRLVVTAAAVVAVVWALVGRPVTQRVSDAVADALHQATSSVAEHDLAVLRERLGIASRRLDEAKSRRGRLAAILQGTKASRLALQKEAAKSKVVLKEIAGLLGAPGPVVVVADKPYRRETVEHDALRAVRRYEQATGQLNDLEGQIRELTGALARVDRYIARSEEVLASRDGLVSRLEDRAEYQKLLRDVGELVGGDDGFDMRFERAAAVISPLSAGEDNRDPAGTVSSLGAMANYTGEEP